MDRGFEVFLSRLSEFTETGGDPSDSFVRFMVAALFWFCLFVVSRLGDRRRLRTHDQLLAYGFLFSMSSDLFRAGISAMWILELVDEQMLRVFIKPFEYALGQIALWMIAGGFILYLNYDRRHSLMYLGASIGTTVLIFISTFFWWGRYVTKTPDAEFDQVWPAVLFHVNASLWLVVAAVVIWRNSFGTLRKLAILSMVLFFLAEFLKLPDIFTGGVYEHIYAPFRQLFHTLAIPPIGFVYIVRQHEMNRRVREALRWRAERGEAAAEPIAADAPLRENVEGITVGQAQMAVSSVLGSDTFLSSRKSSGFLRYTSRKLIDGEADSVTAYTIGTEALGQPTNFIPSENAVVRVAALRLRELLRVYYASEGKGDVVVVRMPRGTYLPHFNLRSPLREAA